MTRTIDCEFCEDQGYVIADAPGRSYDGQAIPCPRHCTASREIWRRVISSRLKTARVPDMFAEYTFKTWERDLDPNQKDGKWLAFAAARQFVESRPHWRISRRAVYESIGLPPPEGADSVKTGLMLFGEYGTGKTGLAVSLTRALVEALHPCMYIRVQDLLSEVQSRYRTEGGGNQLSSTQVKETFKTVPVLVIDEFNIANVTPDRLEIMEEIVRARYMSGLPIISTANIGQDDFTAMWGERIAQPMRAACHWIHTGGQNLRPLENSIGGY